MSYLPDLTAEGARAQGSSVRISRTLVESTDFDSIVVVAWRLGEVEAGVPVAGAENGRFEEKMQEQAHGTGRSRRTGLRRVQSQGLVTGCPT